MAAILVSAPASHALAPATSSPAPSPASPEAFPNTINGVLRNAGQPVPGVTIRATGEGFSGETVTSASGAWTIRVPVQGTYQVELDEGTLPEGVALAEGAQNPRTVTFANTSNAGAIFPLGEGIVVQGADFGEQLVERLLAGLSFGMLLALASVGLSLIFGTTGLTNFAHGEMVTLGAVLMFTFSALGLPVWLAAALAILGGGASGYLQDAGLWRPLRGRGSGLIPMMIVSIGLALAARYVVLFFFGGGTQQLPGAQGPQINLGAISISRNTLQSLVISLVVIVLVGFLLLRTRLGKATRAVADNPALASASGI
ncbi:branched-chain amino acid ABC transporter permease, partial [Arthrobacter deserti]|nr:branched-chain amino acid ABC transporter permease [Arthrobacter deserti]